LKQLTAIFLFVILLLNSAGYCLLNIYFENVAYKQMEVQLNKHEYKESDLISIKIPLDLPYYAESKNFERVDGQIELNGVQYNYVKRRVYKDSFELLCIPNYAACEVKQTYHQFLQSVAELPQRPEGNRSSSASLLAKFFSCDYVIVNNNLDLHNMQSSFLKNNYPASSFLSRGCKHLPDQPPELLS